MTITAAADGSSLGNPGPSGWAWVVSDDCWDAGGWVEGTNNLGELTAVLQLLVATREAGLASEHLHIQADSQYAINVISKWMAGWKKRGWTKADKKPIKNLELIQELDREIRGRHVTFEWVKGHAGHPLNERADDRARECAQAYQEGRIPRGGPGFSERPSSAPSSAAPLSAREASTSSTSPAPEAQTSIAHEVHSADTSSPATADAPRSSKSASSPATHAGGEVGIRAVIDAEHAFIAAWRSGNRATLDGLAAPGCRRVWHNGFVADTLMGNSPAEYTYSTPEVTPLGRDAWLVTYTSSWGDGDRAGRARETSVWVLAASDATSPTPSSTHEAQSASAPSPADALSPVGNAPHATALHLVHHQSTAF